MNTISVIMAVFSVLGGIDLIIGNKLGLGKEFENGLKMFGTLALSMLGMLVLAGILFCRKRRKICGTVRKKRLRSVLTTALPKIFV